PGVPPPPAPPRTADAAQIHVGDDSGVHAAAKSPSSARSRVSSRRSNLPGMLVGGAAGACALLIGAYFLLRPDEAPAPPVTVTTDPAATSAANSPANASAAADSQPRIDPGSDITVGPEGHFATIGEAIAYVVKNYQPLSGTDQRTIKVAGGATYAEAIEIDNTGFGAFPKGVRIVCEGPQPAVLAPPGSGP